MATARTASVPTASVVGSNDRVKGAMLLNLPQWARRERSRRGELSGTYWIRTSDPYLVEVVL